MLATVILIVVQPVAVCFIYPIKIQIVQGQETKNYVSQCALLGIERGVGLKPVVNNGGTKR